MNREIRKPAKILANICPSVRLAQSGSGSSVFPALNISLLLVSLSVCSTITASTENGAVKFHTRPHIPHSTSVDCGYQW